MKCENKRGESILEACKETFSKRNPLHKMFNKNTLKVSYSCMDNEACLYYQHTIETIYIQKSLNLIVTPDQGPIYHLTANP